MKWLITFLLICTIAVVVSVSAVGQAGQVQIFVPPNTQITLSLNLAVLLLVGSFFLLYALLRFARYTIGLPEQVRRYRLERQKTQSRQWLNEATIAMMDGRYGHSVKMADKALECDEFPEFNRLIAARSIHHLHQLDKRDAWFMEAEQKPELKNAVEISRAGLLFDTTHYQEAEAAIERIPVKDRSALANRLLIKSCFGRGDWNKALSLLRDFGRRGERNKTQIAVLKRTAQQHLLDDMTLTSDQLNHAWKMAPDDERTDPYILVAFVNAAIRVENYRFARTLLENALARDWNTDLVRLYGAFMDPDADSSQIECAESWLKEHPDDANLLYALGKLCCYKQLWGKAKTYFEASLAIEPSIDTQLALAKLLEHLGETEEAHVLFRIVALTEHPEISTL